MGKESRRSKKYRDDRCEREEEKFLKKIELNNEKLPLAYVEKMKRWEQERVDQILESKELNGEEELVEEYNGKAKENV